MSGLCKIHALFDRVQITFFSEQNANVSITREAW